MRAAARVSRFGFPFVLLLVLLGLTVVPARNAGHGDAGLHRVVGESVSTAPSMHDDLHDRPRLAVTAAHAPAAALYEAWWALCSRETDRSGRYGRAPLGGTADSAVAVAAPTPQSTRAPPSTCTG
ncbi:hypothetical protein B0I31_12451 [Saccharothrix carnea]|uniref:Uncharacterized protein n=1 Tax=Saccharothrix carnea TaxID=1280637 RepID=A0A2P8HR53_SACCR|nr:hypothetical protein [Saccharothrix carnea]PSL48664.1 hypothetical protein B0I31_12451 [Saccharothrix carnea]